MMYTGNVQLGYDEVFPNLRWSYYFLIFVNKCWKMWIIFLLVVWALDFMLLSHNVHHFLDRVLTVGRAKPEVADIAVICIDLTNSWQANITS